MVSLWDVDTFKDALELLERKKEKIDFLENKCVGCDSRGSCLDQLVLESFVLGIKRSHRNLAKGYDLRAKRYLEENDSFPDDSGIPDRINETYEIPEGKDDLLEMLSDLLASIPPGSGMRIFTRVRRSDATDNPGSGTDG